jgi:hypothetical protein
MKPFSKFSVLLVASFFPGTLFGQETTKTGLPAGGADSDGDGDEWGGDEDTVTRVEGWLACVLELLAGVFLESA